MLKIDGSMGEGGGQVLRTALGLSSLTGQPFEIDGIRAKRRRPGLMQQHLTAVHAAARVCNGHVEGGTLGSQCLRFRPGPVGPGVFHFAVGTAGSAALVLQTVLPPLLCAEGPSSLRLEGGTHNPMAPPFDFLDRSFLPLVGRMGARVSARLDRWGFYPAGGGVVEVEIAPCPRLTPIEIVERSPIHRLSARAAVSRLPRSIAERELRVVAEHLGLHPSSLEAHEVARAHGPGNVVSVDVPMDSHHEIFTSFGARGRRAEAVAEDVVGQVEEYVASGQPVGPYLADQLLIPFAMAGGVFLTGPPSGHTVTNVDVVRRFLSVDLLCRERARGAWEVTARV